MQEIYYIYYNTFLFAYISFIEYTRFNKVTKYYNNVYFLLTRTFDFLEINIQQNVMNKI